MLSLVCEGKLALALACSRLRLKVSQQSEICIIIIDIFGIIFQVNIYLHY